MTQTELLNTIRAEIMRLKLNVYDEANQFDIGARSSLTYLDSFLDTLQEPENPIYELNQFLINWVRDGQTDAEKDARWEAYRRFFELHDEAMMQEPNAADEKAVKEIVKTTHKEVTRQVKEMVEEQPASEELEEEIKRYRKEEMPIVLESDLNDIARHFAEWGEKNAYKDIMKKADGVRDKRFDTDYEVKIEPAAGFDWDCVNVYREGKLVGQYAKPKEEKKLPEGLEEAANKYLDRIFGKGKHEDFYVQLFKAGAEWQKAKMMEGAVEGEVYLYNGYKREAIAILVNIPKDKLGDKVKVIFIKEDEK